MAGCYKNILFDLDGTLTDSALGITKSVQFALKNFGLEVEAYHLKGFIGPPLQQSFKNFYGFSDADIFKAVECYRSYYRRKGIYENRLYPGIGNLLQALYDRGLELHLATSKPTLFAGKVLKHFGVDHYFKTIAGSNLDGTRANKSEVIEYVIDQNSYIRLKETVMIGDHKYDIIGARAHNIDSIAVTYGYGPVTELTEAGPTALVHSVSELSKLLL